MNRHENFRLTRVRILTFAFVTVLHITLLFLVVFKMETIVTIPEPVAGVMKLVDVQERIPPPPRQPEELQPETQDAIAETMIETDEPPPPLSTAIGTPGAVSDRAGAYAGFGHIDYLPQHLLSALAVLPEAEIIRAVVYPPIALRSGIEGTVFLDLFIDSEGNIRSITILRENPPGRGFGEAAVNTLKGFKASKPGEANGVAVASRLRYVFRFTLK